MSAAEGLWSQSHYWFKIKGKMNLDVFWLCWSMSYDVTSLGPWVWRYTMPGWHCLSSCLVRPRRLAWSTSAQTLTILCSKLHCPCTVSALTESEDFPTVFCSLYKTRIFGLHGGRTFGFKYCCLSHWLEFHKSSQLWFGVWADAPRILKWYTSTIFPSVFMWNNVSALTLKTTHQLQDLSDVQNASCLTVSSSEDFKYC